MLNLVELAAEDNEQKQSPCIYGNIVLGHACYCHHDSGPRKCHIWRNADEWNRANCELFELAKKG